MSAREGAASNSTSLYGPIFMRQSALAYDWQQRFHSDITGFITESARARLAEKGD